MNKPFIKKILFFLLITSFFILIFTFSCPIAEIKKIADDPDFKAKWDTSLRALVVDLNKSMREDVEGKTINVYAPALNLPSWPINQSSDLTAVINNVDISGIVDIDVDGIGGNDFEIQGIYSKNASLILRVWYDLGYIDNNQITITYITIEGVQYNLVYSGRDINNKLVYTATNFLDSSNEYYLDFINGGSPRTQLNINAFPVTLNNTPATPSYGAGTLNFEAQIGLGNYGVVGTIIQQAELYNESNLEIPINGLPVKSLDNFKLEFEYTSNLPFTLDMEVTFHGTGIPPSPPNFNSVINSGILSTSPLHGYQFVSTSNISIDEFKFNDDILDYGNMSLDIKLIMPDGTVGLPTSAVRLDMNYNIKVKVIASADATISL